MCCSYPAVGTSTNKRTRYSPEHKGAGGHRYETDRRKIGTHRGHGRPGEVLMPAPGKYRERKGGDDKDQPRDVKRAGKLHAGCVPEEGDANCHPRGQLEHMHTHRACEPVQVPRCLCGNNNGKCSKPQEVECCEHHNRTGQKRSHLCWSLSLGGSWMAPGVSQADRSRNARLELLLREVAQAENGTPVPGRYRRACSLIQGFGCKS
jgi:hypothetical protein